MNKKIDTSQFLKPDAKIRELARQAHARDIAKGIPEEEAFPEHVLIVPKHLRHRPRPGALEPRNIKVRISIYLDLDILDHFKARAEKSGTPYQTQINAALRNIIENGTSPRDQLRQAQHLITTALEALP